MNAINFNEQLNLNKLGDVDCYHSLGHSYKSASFDTLRARYILAREHYLATLCMINAEMKEEVAKYNDKRMKMRANCSWIYSIEQKTKEEKVYYSISSNPEYVIEGDEDYYKERKHQQFFIVNNVVVIVGGGYTFKHIQSGDTLFDFEITELLECIVPERFTNK